jgi:hypothetical protein
MQTVVPGSLLGPETPTIQTPLESMKPQRPPSQSMVETLKGKKTLRSVRETIQVEYSPLPLLIPLRRDPARNHLPLPTLVEARVCYPLLLALIPNQLPKRLGNLHGLRCPK